MRTHTSSLVQANDNSNENDDVGDDNKTNRQGKAVVESFWFHPAAVNIIQL